MKHYVRLDLWLISSREGRKSADLLEKGVSYASPMKSDLPISKPLFRRMS